MPSKRSIRSSEEIIERLVDEDKQLNPEDLKSLSRSQLVHEGRKYKVLNDTEFQASIPSDNYVVKSYLWSYLDDPIHRERVHHYVILCTKIQHRAYLTLKTAYFLCATGHFGPRYSVEAFVKALLTNPAQGFEYLVLPEHFPNTSHPLRSIVDSTRQVYPVFQDGLCASLEFLITRSGLDNAKKYIATKVRTAVFNHVFVHLHNRVKGSLEARKHPEEQSDLDGMKELYFKGVTDKNVGPRDRETVVTLRKVFLSDGAARNDTEIPEASSTPKASEMLLHLECCRLAEDTSRTFTPFPNASCSRCYQRLCTRLFCLLLRVDDMQATINLSPSLARRRAQKTRDRRLSEKNKNNKRRNGYFTMRRNEKDALVTSIETDGVGMSIVLLVERPQRFQKSVKDDIHLSAKQKREFAEKKRRDKIEKLATFSNNEENNAICRGLDPGRVNLFTTAEKSRVNQDTTKYEKRYYSRTRHLEKCGRDRMREWRDQRAQQPAVAAALKALATTGGAKTHVASRWFAYLHERFTYQEVLEDEFMKNDERYKKKMVQFRLSQRALPKVPPVARAADRLVLEGNEPNQKKERRPVIIGYGTGRGNGGGHKGEPSVPVKAMYRALLQAFKRHRIQGGVLDVWEHLTTQKCYKCHETMKVRDISWTEKDAEREKKRLTEKWEVCCREAREKNEDIPLLELPSDEELLNRQKRDRDFRICEHCCSSNQPWKLRNRDFNAAINILVLLDKELSGEERPEYLCTQKDPSHKKKKKKSQ